MAEEFESRPIMLRGAANIVLSFYEEALDREQIEQSPEHNAPLSLLLVIATNNEEIFDGLLRGFKIARRAVGADEAASLRTSAFYLIRVKEVLREGVEKYDENQRDAARKLLDFMFPLPNE